MFSDMGLLLRGERPPGQLPRAAQIGRGPGGGYTTLAPVADHFHVHDALAKVAELGRKPGHFAPQQFDPEWDVEENAPGPTRRRSPSCPAWSRSFQPATTQRPWHESAPGTGVRHLGHLASSFAALR